MRPKACPAACSRDSPTELKSSRSRSFRPQGAHSTDRSGSSGSITRSRTSRVIAATGSMRDTGSAHRRTTRSYSVAGASSRTSRHSRATRAPCSSLTWMRWSRTRPTLHATTWVWRHGLRDFRPGTPAS